MMARFCTTTVTFAILVCAIPAAPLPKDKNDPPLYFPVEVGATWIYTSSGKDRRQTVESVKVTEEGVVVLVRYSTGEGKPSGSWTVLVTPNGLTNIPNDKDESLYRPLILPPNPERPWRGYKDLPGSGKWVYNDTILAAHEPEWITVPAGTFKAIRVEGATSAPFQGNKKDRDTTWYAPGIGRIKSEYNGREISVLKSFSPRGIK